MSVRSEITRIEAAKTAISTAIAGKGVTVPAGTKLDGMASLIAGIEQGSDPVLQSKTVSPTTSAQTVKPDSGYDALSQVTVNAMPTATQATPSISVSSAGLITASATQSAGYVSAGTKSATKQLTTQAAQTITPGTSNKTIASGRYLTGTQTIKGDANLKAANIAKGVSIFGVNGTHEGGEDISSETAQYTTLLNNLETAIDALPEAGSGGGGQLEPGWVDIVNGLIPLTYSEDSGIGSIVAKPYFWAGSSGAVYEDIMMLPMSECDDGNIAYLETDIHIGGSMTVFSPYPLSFETDGGGYIIHLCEEMGITDMGYVYIIYPYVTNTTGVTIHATLA